MEKIIQTFKNLYTGENIWKRHLKYLVLLFLPVLAGVIFSQVDKGNGLGQNITYTITGAAVSVIAIPAVITLLGLIFQFMNRKINQNISEFPDYDYGTFKTGFKGLPVAIVWFLYILAAIIVCSAVVFSYLLLVSIKFSVNNLPAAVLLFSGMIVIFFAMIVFWYIVTAFINYVYLNYCETFDYKSGVFNITLLFKFIKNSFKETIILSLKYVLAGLTVFVIFQLVYTFFVFVLTLGFYLFLNVEEQYSSIFILIISFIGGFVHSYLNGIINFAFVDNLGDIYREKFPKNKLQAGE